MIVSVRELKNRLSEYLRRIQSGEEVLITSHGKPVGRLLPIASETKTEKEAIQRLRGLPFVRAGQGGKLKPSKHPMQWKQNDKLLSELVMEDRE